MLLLTSPEPNGVRRPVLRYRYAEHLGRNVACGDVSLTDGGGWYRRTRGFPTNQETPVKVIITEYTAIAEAYNGDVSFINAILDKVARKLRTKEI